MFGSVKYSVVGKSSMFGLVFHLTSTRKIRALKLSSHGCFACHHSVRVVRMKWREAAPQPVPRLASLLAAVLAGRPQLTPAATGSSWGSCRCDLVGTLRKKKKKNKCAHPQAAKHGCRGEVKGGAGQRSNMAAVFHQFDCRSLCD